MGFLPTFCKVCYLLATVTTEERLCRQSLGRYIIANDNILSVCVLNNLLCAFFKYRSPVPRGKREKTGTQTVTSGKLESQRLSWYRSVLGGNLQIRESTTKRGIPQIFLNVCLIQWLNGKQCHSGWFDVK